MHPVSGTLCVLETVSDPEEGDIPFFGCRHTKCAGAAGKCRLLSLGSLALQLYPRFLLGAL